MSATRTFVVTVREVDSPAEAERIAAKAAVGAAGGGTETPAADAVRKALLDMGEDEAWTQLNLYYLDLIANTNLTAQAANGILKAKMLKVFGSLESDCSLDASLEGDVDPRIKSLLVAEYKEFKKSQGNGPSPRRAPMRPRKPMDDFTADIPF